MKAGDSSQVEEPGDHAAAEYEIDRPGRCFGVEERLYKTAVRGELELADVFETVCVTVAALAELSHSTIEVIRPLMQSVRDDGVLVPCKVAGLSWETLSAILDCRFASGSMGPHELAKAKAQFAKITPDNARRLLRFWQVRSSSSPSSVH